MATVHYYRICQVVKTDAAGGLVLEVFIYQLGLLLGLLLGYDLGVSISR